MAMLLVGNRYNRTFELMNFILCAYNTTGHNIVQPTTVCHNQYVEPTAINILIDTFQKYFLCFSCIIEFTIGGCKQTNKQVCTVKPLNKGHSGDGPVVPCREVVLFLEVFFSTYWKFLKNEM